MKGNRRQTLMLQMCVGAGICGISMAWFGGRRKGSTGVEYEESEYKKSERGTEADVRADKKIRQRRVIQQRIRRWNKACKRIYDGKDRMKYRQKIRASTRWIRKRVITEAKEANIREGRKRGRQERKKDARKREGMGGGGRAKALITSS
eukprot:4744480-Pleurochrysis_carterae.AAC.1